MQMVIRPLMYLPKLLLSLSRNLNMYVTSKDSECRKCLFVFELLRIVRIAILGFNVWAVLRWHSVHL
ncbi:hypothetical protein GYMLUDRAFT_927066 [Collybiopsis luxurians FD-317 M1]|uniref:Uncharacterized protein n=1 Tax=Collybiopsis luxurians FD-317 M1 TaxID=944289 RepID=A0A0D0AT18_9AGAR|nr:hypothetical protein GYMLUDRAFT_927066 [Collybiopsis luxurians FD-317 M1]